MSRIPQNSFSRGEVDPEVHGRRDVDAFRTFLKTGRNTQVRIKGGISNRSGTEYLAPFKDHTKVAKLVPFEFGTTDTHMLEFGDQYIRFMRNDAHIVETAKTITGVTQANPIVITAVGHGYTTGEEVFHDLVVGMIELNGRRFKITTLTADTYSIQDQITGVDIDGTGYTAYTSGGEASRIYEIASPYLEADLPFLKFKQSFDFLTIVRQGVATQNLKRLALDSWTLTPALVAPTQDPPTNVAITVNAVGTDTARYAVTSVNADTSEESLAGLSSVTAYTITGITKANPAVVTITAPAAGFEPNTGHEMEIDSVVGMTELNGRRVKVTKLTATTYELQGIDSTLFTAYGSAGTMTPAFDIVTTSLSGTSTDNTVDWSPVDNTLRYHVYKEENGVFGFLGETADVSYLDNGTLSPDLQDSAPFFQDPFFGDGNEPGAVGDHLQRAVYGGSINAPDKQTFSRVGAFTNFNRSSPLRMDDAFSTFLNGTEVNEIRHFVSARDLLTFTNSAIWPISSGQDAFWLSTIKQVRGLKMGCSHRPPLEIGKKILFEQELGESIRALEYEFTVDGYEPEEVSLFSSHFFADDRMTDWDFIPWPEPLVLMTMESGKVISLTYNPEEQAQVAGFCRWDTEGDYEGIAALRPSADDREKTAYFAVKRVIGGQVVRFIEKLKPRIFEVVEDAFFVDCGTTYDVPITIDNIVTANPLIIEKTAHGLSNDAIIELSDIDWVPIVDTSFNETNPDQLNGRRYKVVNSTANDFQIQRIDGDRSIVDGSAYAAYVSGGNIRLTVQSLSGFRYLAGETVIGLLDGNVERDLAVSSEGVITLPRRTARAHIGIGYVSDVETLTPVSKSINFQIDGEYVKSTQVSIDFYKSRGLLIGPNKDNLDPWKQREFERYGEPTNLYTGPEIFPIAADVSLNPGVFIRQKDPLPMTIRGINPDYV